MQRRTAFLAAFRKPLPALVASVLAAFPALADDSAGVQGACALSDVPAGTVVEVVDGDTLRLDDGRTVRLAGIEAPKPYLVHDGRAVEALAVAAREALERLASGVRVALRVGGIEQDRYGRVLAQVFRDGDGTWLQEALIRAGFARVRPFAGDASCLAELSASEREARAAARGLWRNAEYSVLSAYDPSLTERKGLYVVVEGRVVSVGRGNRVDFLNFGRNWQRDFTVLVEPAVADRLADVGVPVDSLAERRVRVRGVLEEGGGPAIRLSGPGEIEVLGDG